MDQYDLMKQDCEKDLDSEIARYKMTQAGEA